MGVRLLEGTFIRINGDWHTSSLKVKQNVTEQPNLLDNVYFLCFTDSEKSAQEVIFETLMEEKHQALALSEVQIFSKNLYIDSTTFILAQALLS